jgi:hypothetical protein
MEWVMQDRRVVFGPSTPPNQRLTRGQKGILVVLALVTLVVYGILAMFIARVQPWGAPAPAAHAAVAASARPGLQGAHERAHAWAVGWQRDAQLVGAAARWQLTGGETLAPDRASWSFSFYSPAAQQVQVLTADGTVARPVRQVPVKQAPVPVQADWGLDSRDLVVIFMAHGGEPFLRQHAHVSVHFRLSGQDAGRPIWYLAAIAPEARQSFMVGVDALTRQVVLKE